MASRSYLSKDIEPVNCSLIVLLFVLILLAPTIQVSTVRNSGIVSAECQPGVQNAYPENATEGQRIAITTTVSSACVPSYAYDQVIVNILPPGSSHILSTAPASPAINAATAPTAPGPWSLIVQVMWNDPPSGGTMETFQTTIIITVLH